MRVFALLLVLSSVASGGKNLPPIADDTTCVTPEQQFLGRCSDSPPPPGHKIYVYKYVDSCRLLMWIAVAFLILDLRWYKPEQHLADLTKWARRLGRSVPKVYHVLDAFGAKNDASKRTHYKMNQV